MAKLPRTRRCCCRDDKEGKNAERDDGDIGIAIVYIGIVYSIKLVIQSQTEGWVTPQTDQQGVLAFTGRDQSFRRSHVLQFQQNRKG